MQVIYNSYIFIMLQIDGMALFLASKEKPNEAKRYLNIFV